MRRSLGRGAGVAPVAVLGLWSALALVVQRWASWDAGIREQFASDVQPYETIARAAPTFPETHVLRAYAERFPVHWLVGVLADGTGIALHSLYRVADLVVLALVLVAAHAALRRLRLGSREHAVAIGAIAASAYPIHYLLAAPGMLSDGLFVLGLSVAALGFVRESFWLALAGLVLATLGRQTALPVTLAAAVWTALVPAWRHTRRRYSAAVVLVPAAAYGVLHFVADRFSQPRTAGVDDLTVWGYIVDPPGFADHLGRIVIGVLVPVALVASAWLRVRGPLPLGPLVLAAAVVAQPLLLGPLANKDNEPRLAGLAAPALAVAAGMLLRGAQLSRLETFVGVVAVAVGGLHPRYTNVGLHRSAEWVALEVVAALALLVVLGRSWPVKRRYAGLDTTSRSPASYSSSSRR